MIIDAHNHLGGPDKTDGKSQSAEEILKVMDEAGIDRAVVFPFNEENPGVSFSRTNDFIAKTAVCYPDRLTGFCRLDPNAGSAALREFERCIKYLGLRGIKLHPSSQNFSLDHPVLSDILAMAEEEGTIVLFDTGKEMSPPAGIAKLAGKYPRLTFIMAHMNLFEESIAAALFAPNIYVQTTGYFNTKRLGEAVTRLGAGRIIMGSDSPYLKMGREVEKVRGIPGTTPEEFSLIAGRNAVKVLGL